jgi:uncharacterized protein YbaP (TraB family)
MRKLFSFPLAAAAALAASSAVAAPPLNDLNPALWVVKDSDTTVYLFGTVHALKPGLEWFNDEVKMAFDASNALFVEVQLPEDQQLLAEQVRKYGMLPTGKTLPSMLSKQGAQALGDDLAALGLPRTTLDAYKPFFAAVSLTMLHLMKDGLSADEGVEKLLEKSAKAASKPVGSLETMEFQLSLFDALPQAEQVRMLEDGLKNKEFANGNLDDIVAAWGKGDAEGVAKIINKTDNDSPLLYKKLLSERNVNWAGWVQQRLATPGVTFVAVGAAHLAGPDSVQAVLAKRGIRAARVPHVE